MKKSVRLNNVFVSQTGNRFTWRLNSASTCFLLASASVSESRNLFITLTPKLRSLCSFRTWSPLDKRKIYVHQRKIYVKKEKNLHQLKNMRPKIIITWQLAMESIWTSLGVRLELIWALIREVLRLDQSLTKGHRSSWTVIEVILTAPVQNHL